MTQPDNTQPTKPTTKARLESIVKSEPAKYIALPAAVALIAGIAVMYTKRLLYDNKTVEEKNAVKEKLFNSAGTAVGGAAGYVGAKTLNPYDEKKP